jgi:hypothetical protein
MPSAAEYFPVDYFPVWVSNNNLTSATLAVTADGAWERERQRVEERDREWNREKEREKERGEGKVISTDESRNKIQRRKMRSI